MTDLSASLAEFMLNAYGVTMEVRTNGDDLLRDQDWSAWRAFAALPELGIRRAAKLGWLVSTARSLPAGAAFAQHAAVRARELERAAAIED